MGRLSLTPSFVPGQVLGSWRIIEAFSHPVRRERMYRCVCECGSIKDVKHIHLAGGKTRSCGCSVVTHGMTKSKEYRIWDSMIRRCRNPNHHAFPSYGGRGITVCDKWLTFKGFFEDMGTKPDGLSLDRIDNSLGYSKENCRWGSIDEQARNRRSTKLTQEKVASIKDMLASGVTQAEVAACFGVSRSNVGHIAQGSTWR